MSGTVAARAVVHEAVGAPPVVDEIDVALPIGDEVLVRIEAAGICHTDLSCTDGTLDVPLPAVLGHEGAGIIESVGPDATGVAVGDRVVLAIVHACGSCGPCQRGFPAQCVERGIARPRFSRRGEPVVQMFGTGTFSERVVVRRRSIAPVPDAVPLEVAAVVGCAVVTGAGAVFNVAPPPRGGRVAVVGCGGVGLSAVMAARVAGAERIVAVDPDEGRRAHALTVGATDAAIPDVEAVVTAAGGQLDVVYEAAGVAGAAELAVAVAGTGGTIVLMGVPGATTTAAIPLFPFILAEKSIVGCNMGRVRTAVDFDRIFRLYGRGMLPLDSLVSHRVPLSEAPSAFVRAAARDGVRVVLTPG